jgi:hypothetical protein
MMATLHIVYDPRDQIRHDNQMNKQFGIKVAVLSIHEDLDNSDRTEIAKQLAEMLLEQL